MNKKAILLPLGILFLLLGIGLLFAGLPRAGGGFAIGGAVLMYHAAPDSVKRILRMRKE